MVLGMFLGALILGAGVLLGFVVGFTAGRADALQRMVEGGATTMALGALGRRTDD